MPYWLRATLLAIVIVGGAAAIFLTQIDSNSTVNALKQSGKRGDCIRDVVATADENFRHDVRDLILAGRDQAKVDEIIERMKNRPNYADTAIKKCGPAPH